MQSTECTLVQPAPQSEQYVCRDAQQKCELGVAQATFSGSGIEGVAKAEAAMQTCNDRPGCRYDPGECYCHCAGYGRTTVADGPEAEQCNCFCGGGPPPTCAAGADPTD